MKLEKQKHKLCLSTFKNIYGTKTEVETLTSRKFSFKKCYDKELRQS